MNAMKTIFFSFCLVFFAAQILPAQTTIATGSIQGTVTDSSGAVVEDASVVITNKATGQAISRATSGGGVYSSGALTPGSYDVRVEAKGLDRKSVV